MLHTAPYVNAGDLKSGSHASLPASPQTQFVCFSLVFQSASEYCGPGPVRFRRLFTDRHPKGILQVPSWSSWVCFQKSQFSSPIFQCGKKFTAPGECHIPALQLLPAPSPSRPQLAQPVPRGNSFSSFSVDSWASFTVAGSILVASFDSWRVLATKSECVQLRVQMGKEESPSTIQRGC